MTDYADFLKQLEDQVLQEAASMSNAVVAAGEEFDESEHPRDEKGMFRESGTGVVSTDKGISGSAPKSYTLVYAAVDLPTGMTRMFGLLHNGKVYTKVSAMSPIGVLNDEQAKQFKPLPDKEKSAYKQWLNTKSKGKTKNDALRIEDLEKNADKLISEGIQRNSVQQSGLNEYERSQRLNQEFQLPASELKQGDVVELQFDKSKWTISSVEKDRVMGLKEGTDTPVVLGGKVVKGYIKSPDKKDSEIKWKIPDGAKIVKMSPMEYIDRVSIENRLTTEQVKQSEDRAKSNKSPGILYYPPLSENSLASIKAGVKSGSEIDAISIAYRDGKFDNQEGFHRALVAKELGVKELPVVIYGDFVATYKKPTRTLDEEMELYKTAKAKSGAAINQSNPESGLIGAGEGFDESEHPRAPDGKFSSKGDGVLSKLSQGAWIEKSSLKEYKLSLSKMDMTQIKAEGVQITMSKDDIYGSINTWYIGNERARNFDFLVTDSFDLDITKSRMPVAERQFKRNVPSTDENRELIQKLYLNTQESLRDAPATITVYRGVDGNTKDKFSSATIGETVEVECYNISSWSTDPKMAEKFATEDYRGGVVIEAQIPKEQILIHYDNSVKGIPAEKEVVIIGNKIPAKIVTVIHDIHREDKLPPDSEHVSIHGMKQVIKRRSGRVGQFDSDKEGAAYDESQHPRDESGQWTSTGGVGGRELSMAQKIWYNENAAKVAATMEAGQFTKPQADEHMKKLQVILRTTAEKRKQGMYMQEAFAKAIKTDPKIEEKDQKMLDMLNKDLKSGFIDREYYDNSIRDMEKIASERQANQTKNLASLAAKQQELDAPPDFNEISPEQRAANKASWQGEAVKPETQTKPDDPFSTKLTNPDVKTDYQSSLQELKTELETGKIGKIEHDQRVTILQEIALIKQKAKEPPETAHIPHEPGKPYLAEPTEDEIKVYENDKDKRFDERDYYPPIARKEQVLRVVAKSSEALGEVKVVILPYALADANGFTDIRTPGTIYLGQRVVGEEQNVLISTGILGLAESIQAKSQIDREVVKQFTNTGFAAWKGKLSTLTKDDELERTLMHENGHLFTFHWMEKETGSALNYRGNIMLDTFREYRNHPSFGTDERLHSLRGDITAYHTGEAIAEDLRIMNGEKFGQGQALFPSHYSAEGDLIHPENIMERRAILKKIFKMEG